MQVETIDAPTLVLHGADDELLSVEHGEHTAQVIPGATIKIYKNMGHSLPDHVIPEMVSDILGHLNTKHTLASSK